MTRFNQIMIATRHYDLTIGGTHQTVVSPLYMSKVGSNMVIKLLNDALFKIFCQVLSLLHPVRSL